MILVLYRYSSHIYCLRVTFYYAATTQVWHLFKEYYAMYTAFICSIASHVNDNITCLFLCALDTFEVRYFLEVENKADGKV